MKITKEIESLFSLALSLDQGGNFKNSIHAKGKDIYILNFDRTVILRFFGESEFFDQEVNFYANDYVSSDFRVEEGGRIVFVKKDYKGFDVYRSSRIPEVSFHEIQKYFESLRFDRRISNRIYLSGEVSNDLIDSDLSHIEIYSRDGRLFLIQRDVFSGNVTTLEKKSRGIFDSSDFIRSDFGPIGIRTKDFQSLFLFSPLIEFSILPGKSYIWIEGKGPARFFFNMEGVMGTCLYDEMGVVNYISEGGLNGREIQKDGQSEQNFNRAVGGIKRIHRRIR